MKNIKSNATFLHEIVIVFSPIYLSEATYVISSFNQKFGSRKFPGETDDMV